MAYGAFQSGIYASPSIENLYGDLSVPLYF